MKRGKKTKRKNKKTKKINKKHKLSNLSKKHKEKSKKENKRVKKKKRIIKDKRFSVIKHKTTHSKTKNSNHKKVKSHSKKHHEEKNPKHKEEKEHHGKVIEEYNIEVDKAEVEIKIEKNRTDITYNLYIPEISPITKNFLDDLRNDLISITTISMKELTDPKSFSVIKKRFMSEATKIIKERLPNIKETTKFFLIGTLMQEMLGLGRIEFLIADPNLEEIVITSAKEPIRVYTKKYGWLRTNIIIEKEEEIVNYANIIARRIGRQITVLNPLLDAHLVTGDRINAVLYPINTKGNTITIRKFSRDPYSIIDLLDSKTCSSEVAALLWLAIEYEMNIIISGGTASGKTVFLNACLPFIPPNHRIISIEDTRELTLPEFLYWTPLVTRTANPEGKGEVSMLNLLINSLRMRPDRIILGEMRRHEEAMVLFEAMHTGHSVYATLHADSSAETVSRLINPPLSIPPNLLRSVNLNVVMFRDRRKGIRRVVHVAEIDASEDSAKSHILYRWAPDRDKIVKHNESMRFFEEVSRHTGMSDTEITNNLREKEKILKFLQKNKIRSLKEFGEVINLYYKDKDILMKQINKNSIKGIFGNEK